MGAGALDRRLQFRRSTPTDDGLQQVDVWADHGLPVWGSRQDVRDSEKVASDQAMATLMSRFVVRSSAFARGIDPKDRFTCDGREWQILGVKEIGRNDRLELTAAAEAD